MSFVDWSRGLDFIINTAPIAIVAWLTISFGNFVVRSNRRCGQAEEDLLKEYEPQCCNKKGRCNRSHDLPLSYKPRNKCRCDRCGNTVSIVRLPA